MSESMHGNWRERAECLKADPEVFFSGDVRKVNSNDPNTLEAKKYCGVCVVRLTCLEVALVNKEGYGIWGGLTTNERKKITREANRNVSSGV
jgi:WhiB family redox-sensing transcriptional regulator